MDGGRGALRDPCKCPRTTAERYFGNYDDLTRARTLGDGRVTVELGQIWEGEPFNDNLPTAHQLLEYWGIDPTC